MDIRQLQYLIALSQEKHFTRAAKACKISQPTLSGRLRQLEKELGVPIVSRGHRYHGLTEEGMRIVAWAQRILENCDGMREELAALSGDLRGRITLGAIPSALTMAPVLTEPLRKSFPQVGFTVLMRNSSEIAHQLGDYSIDAGITYLDNEPVANSLTFPLYKERYRLFLHESHPFADRDTATWTEAAGLSLCALTPDTQNRRIVDAAFRQVDCKPEPEIESNSINNLCCYVQTGAYAAVLPENQMTVVGQTGGLRAIPLVAPNIEHVVGLVILDRDPLPILVASLAEAARDFKEKLC